MPQHVADLVYRQSAQCRQPLFGFRRAEALPLDQTVELGVDPRVEEQLPIIEQNLAARPLFEDFAAGTLQQDDVFRQVFRGAESDLAAIGDFQQCLLRDDIGLAVGHAKSHARQGSMQRTTRRKSRGSTSRAAGSTDGQGLLQFRQADPRIVSRSKLFAARAEPFPGILHRGGLYGNLYCRFFGSKSASL